MRGVVALRGASRCQPGIGCGHTLRRPFMVKITLEMNRQRDNRRQNLINRCRQRGISEKSGPLRDLLFLTTRALRAGAPSLRFGATGATCAMGGWISGLNTGMIDGAS